MIVIVQRGLALYTCPKEDNHSCTKALCQLFSPNIAELSQVICFSNAVTGPSRLVKFIGVTGIDGSGGKKWLSGVDMGNAGIVT
jgi:hypothetical protein